MAPEKRVFSLKEVQQHNQPNDMWIVIHDAVYDVTKFLDEHPGGEEVLRDVGGKVATENFEDVGHSSDARDLMKQYRIGEVREEEKQFTKEKKIKWASSTHSGAAGTASYLLPIVLALLCSMAYSYFSW